MKAHLLKMGLGLCLWGLAFALSAQKSAPIAGDAAQLIDYLRKDYSSVPLKDRPEEIARDRAKVLAIFKGYLTDEEQGELDSVKVADDSELDSIIKEYKLEIEFNRSLKSNPIRIDNKAQYGDFVKELKDADSTLESIRKNYLREIYQKDSSEFSTISDGIEADNPYLKHMLVDFQTKYQNLQEYKTDAQAQAAYQSAIQKSIPFIGGDIAFSTAIEGLSRFIAKRLKQELNVYVIGQFQEWLRKSGPNDPLAELKVMLPRTLEYLLQFDASQFTSFTDDIKQYIEEDFNNILSNAANLKDTPRFKRLVEAYPETAFAFEALEFIPQLSKMSRPIEYFGLIEQSETVAEWADSSKYPVRFNIANSLKLSSLLAHSLTVVKNGQLRFASLDFLGNYAAEPEFYLLYMGFLHQQNRKYEDIKFVGKKAEVFNLDSMLQASMTKPADIQASSDQVKSLSQMLTRIGKSSTEVFEQGQAIRKANKRGEPVGADTVFQFIGSTIDLAEQIAKSGDDFVKLVWGSSELELAEKTQPYFASARLCNGIVLDFQKQRFAGALLKALELPSKFIPERAEVLTELQNVIDGIAKMEDDATFDDWRLVLKNVNGEKDKDRIRSKKRQEAAGRLVGVVNSLEDYYAEEIKPTREVDSIEDYLDLINDELKKVTDGKSFNMGTLEGLLKQNAVVRLFLSRYLDINIFDFGENLIASLSKLSGGKELLGNDEQKDLKNILNKYFNTGFKVAFLGQDKNNFHTTRKELQTFVSNYLINTIPTRFNLKIHPNVLKLISFLNAMATAETAEDVEAAIEAIALPSGSFAIKRESKVTIAVETMPGFLIGGEYSWNYVSKIDTVTTFTNKVGFSPAFTAPVGLSFAWGGKRKGAKGIFVSLIDVGAVTRLYLDNSDSTETLPELTLRNVFAPGIYGTYGIPKAPISFNVGVQYGPELKLIHQDPLKSMRFGVGITVDIPLLKLYTKPRMSDL